MIVIFGFFYIFYGSILYIFGPIVVALLPLGATNRLAKSYVENVFIWNAWPILYGGFGALLSAVQMGQVGQMLNQNNFLGGLGNLEGSFLIGIASIIFSLAIAIIPFIAKRIVTGDVGSTAGAMIGAAVTALTLGAAAVEGGAVGLAGAGAGGAASGAGSAAGASSASAGSAASAAAGNQPTRPQATPQAAASGGQASSSSTSYPGESLAEAHAEQMRGSFRQAMGMQDAANEPQTPATGDRSGATTGASEDEDAAAETAGSPRAGSPSAQSGRRTGPSAPAGFARRGQSVHRYNIGTWSTYHAARLTARTLAGGPRISEIESRRI